MEQILRDFVTMWVVIDPIGTVPVFVVAGAGMTAVARRRMAFRAAAIAAGILLAFIVVGQILIEALEISLEAFQIAGGLVLFAFAMTMIFGTGKPEIEMDQAEHAETTDPAIFPLAMPSLAGPGAIMAAVVLTDNNRAHIGEQAQTAGITLFVMAIALVLMLASTPIVRLLGKGGVAILSRVMGLILASVAVENVLTGCQMFFARGT